ncbi:minor tail protein [Pseudomonas phage Lana]|uniref:Minor tail protein n=1 Tax=Pseudomonas phage Lana TaxID=2530172 RepID=A0A481W7C7_9CAUD|nr:minor tail protein [Pseudomonas phage Lana]QBJ04558.1 minor tail protein [Pseudomonas phage Lana]
MTNIIATDAQNLSQRGVVELFIIDATKVGQGMLRFTSAVHDPDTQLPLELVMFDGHEYRQLPIAAEGFEWNGTGTAPRPTLTFTALDLILLQEMVNANDLVGCPVQRIKTLRKYLDDGSNPNPEAHYPIDYYEIERKNKQLRQTLIYDLSNKLDQQGKMIPARQVIRDTCQHRYRYYSAGQFRYDGVTCPYAGSNYFLQSGEVTGDPSKDQCGKRISDCSLRFGEDATLPMFAFPGVGRIS